MFQNNKVLQYLKLSVEVCGGWWSAMSGTISIPFAFVALFTEGHPRKYFTFLAFGALLYFAIRVAWKNYQVLVIQKPERNRALLAKMVDDIRSQKPVRNGDPINDYCRRLQPVDPTGALIKFSNEIQTEDDLELFCREFVKLGYLSPFKNFEPQLGNELEWLPVLREARLSQHEIKNEGQLLQFLAFKWTGKEKWKLGQARVLANIQTGNEISTTKQEYKSPSN